MKLKNKYLNELLDFALKIVLKSEKITTKYYRKKNKHKLKKNKTPVTIADFKCEDYLLSKIKAHYKGHDILSEERGVEDNKSDFKWIIDPIDGTRNFMRRLPFWGTLLALEWEGEVILGIISMPAIKEFIFASKGKGCIYNGKKAKVSKIDNVNDSYCLHGGLDYILKQTYSKNFLNLTRQSLYSRGFGDCHGHSLIINGRSEIMVDPHVAPYDIASVKICVEEAGGALTDMKGNKTIYNGNALVTNGKVHDEVLKILNG